MIFFILLLIAVCVLGFVLGIRNNKAVASLKQRIISKYGVNEVHVSSEDKSIVGFNFNAKKIVLASGKNGKQYDFSEIVSVEVVENGTTVTQTNRGSQVIGAAVGGLALGPLGAVVGGLSGKSQSRGRILGISLKVTVDDRLCPVYVICFLRCFSNKGLDPESFSAKQARQSADRFHAHILNAMHQSKPKEGVTPSLHYADELQKLWELKQAGILSADEFADLKARLVSGPGPHVLDQSNLEAPRALSQPDLVSPSTPTPLEFCRTCGSRIYKSGGICVHCAGGKPQKSSMPAIPPPPDSHSKRVISKAGGKISRWILLYVGIMVLAFVGIGILLFQATGDPAAREGLSADFCKQHPNLAACAAPAPIQWPSPMAIFNYICIFFTILSIMTFAMGFLSLLLPKGKSRRPRLLVTAMGFALTLVFFVLGAASSPPENVAREQAAKVREQSERATRETLIKLCDFHWGSV